MTEDEVLAAFKRHFPLDARPECEDRQLTPIQFDSLLLERLVDDVVASTPDYSERTASGIRWAFAGVGAPTWRKFGDLYFDRPQSWWSAEVVRNSFLDGLRYVLHRRVDGSRAHCLAHITRLSAAEKRELYICFFSVFSDPSLLEEATANLEKAKSPGAKPIVAGLNDWAYEVCSDSVAFECDGDGTFEEDEIIRIELSRDEAAIALGAWATTIDECNRQLPPL